MAIQIYNNVILPGDVLAAAGARGRIVRRNARAQAANGAQQIVIIQSRSMREYEFGFIPMPYTVWQTLEGIFEVTDGGAYGFLLEDPKDTTIAAAAGLMYPYTSALVGAIGVGYGVPSYRLYKRYTSIGSTRTKDRRISRPQATPILKRGAATVTYGAAAGNASINLDTGTVTFVADSSSTVTAVTVGASTVVTLTAALAGLIVGNRLYLSGLTGTVAATLNNLSHSITSIAGGGLNVYTLSVTTTGLAWTSGGSGFKYPQSTETVTWSGSMYVPVHFARDEIDWELVMGGTEAQRLIAGPSVMLAEVYEP